MKNGKDREQAPKDWEQTHGEQTRISREQLLADRERVLDDGVAVLACHRRTGIGYCVLVVLAGIGTIWIATMADRSNVAGRWMCFAGGGGLIYFGLWLLCCWLRFSRFVGGYRDELELVREERWLVSRDGRRDIAERLRRSGESGAGGGGEWWDGK